jgi:hypothetical protein
MTRFARPTSITTESCMRARVTLQSQAQRSTVLEETGSENSASVTPSARRAAGIMRKYYKHLF